MMSTQNTTQAGERTHEIETTDEPLRFYCTAPSCSYLAEPGSEHCDLHNGKVAIWHTATKRNGDKVNIRTTSQAQADKIAATL